MSKVLLLGVREMQGDFQGKPYHTIALHIAKPFDKEKSYGKETVVKKVKYERLPFVLSSPVESVRDFANKYIGSDLDISYDENGQPEHITLFHDLDEPDKKK